MKKIRILTSDITNPWFNLATENWIFEQLEANTHILFLWRNQETVVIGSCQNPWVECKVDKMKEDNVYLARRQSGGGAVFQDLGNTNFTFLSPKDEYDNDANFNIITAALQSLNIHAEKSGRNDIQVDAKKVSGSAFKHTKDRVFHHGTLLVNANMKKLADYLNPHPLKLQAKGISSVRARVANLIEYNPELTHEKICQAIVECFCKHHGQTVDIEVLNKSQLSQNKELNAYYTKMSDWDWRFGKTPEFSHNLNTRFDWGIVDMHLNVNLATIDKVTVFSDALDIELIAAIEQQLLNTKYAMGDIQPQLEKLISQKNEWHAPIEELIQWLSTEVKTPSSSH